MRARVWEADAPGQCRRGVGRCRRYFESWVRYFGLPRYSREVSQSHMGCCLRPPASACHTAQTARTGAGRHGRAPADAPSGPSAACHGGLAASARPRYSAAAAGRRYFAVLVVHTASSAWASMGVLSGPPGRGPPLGSRDDRGAVDDGHFSHAPVRSSTAA